MKPSDVVAQRVKAARDGRGWKAADLARFCADAGAPGITASVIANIETGRRGADGQRRRDVTVDELLILAYVLGLPPVDLLVSSEASADEPYSITPLVSAPSARVREWIGGGFLKEPETMLEMAELIRLMPEARAKQLVRAWWTPERERAQNRAALRAERPELFEDDPQ